MSNSADKFNSGQILSGNLSPQMITKLVEDWQRNHGLTVDGFAGANTQASLEPEFSRLVKFWPLANLPDGRRCKITSGFYTENPSRSRHKGIDLFFDWIDSDPDMALGDGGAIMRHGERKWWYPAGKRSIAAAAGIVQIAGKIETGWRCWIDHGNGERTGYFHAKSLLVRVGDIVKAGQEILVVGDSPKGYDARHLHFEVSPVDRYAPMNPREWLKDASYKS